MDYLTKQFEEVLNIKIVFVDIIVNSWDELELYVKFANIDGHTDWRLPTLDEWRKSMDLYTVTDSYNSPHPLYNCYVDRGNIHFQEFAPMGNVALIRDL